MTVPPGRGGQDRAALAAGHVDADHGDVGRPPDGRRHRVAQGDRVAGIGDHHLVGEAGLPQERGLGLVGHHADGAPGARVARRGQAQRAGLAGAADHGDHRPASYCATTRRGQRRGAADVHHRQAEVGRQVVGDAGGDRAAEQDGVPVARHLLGAAVPAGQAVLDHERGEGERDQRGDPVADRQARAGTPGPTSSTVPTSMPPEPVSGFCILPRVGDDVEHRAAYAVTVPSVACRSSCRNDAASRLSRSTRIRTSSGHSSRRVSSRCGRLRQHHPVVQDPVQPGRIAGAHEVSPQ